MALIERDTELVTLVVPAAYLSDAQTAAAREIALDAGAFEAGGADPQDLRSNVEILDRSVRLHEDLLAASDDVTLVAVWDLLSNPLLHLLEQIVRVASERLDETRDYGPAPMREILELADEIRWAAAEAIRIAPTEADWRTAA